MATETTPTVPEAVVTSDTTATEATPELVDESPEEAAPSGPSPEEETATLKARLAEAEAEADKAKRFIVNFVSDRQPQSESIPDRMAGVEPNNFIEQFKENPIGTLDQHFATRMAPIVADNLEARAKDNRSRAIERLGKETWNEYGEAIDEFMGGLSLHTRANPGSYEEALNFVRARNIDKEVDKRVAMRLKQQEDERRGLVEGTGARSGGSINGSSRVAMTEDEKKIAKGFGMSEKEWMKYKTPRGARE